MELEGFVVEYVNNYVSVNQSFQITKYREPVVGYSSASDPLFLKIKDVTVPNHYLPQDFLKEARTVISIFLPFSEEIIKGNYSGKNASKEWAIAYTETNGLLDRLCSDLAGELEKHEYNAVGIKTTHHLSHAKKERYSYDELFDRWSQRHVGYISGIGKFGLNNLIITIRGCAGRIGSIVTSAYIPPTKRDTEPEEYCLVKRGQHCYKCVDNCPVKVIKRDDAQFDRVGCMNFLVKQRKYQEKTYGLIEGTQTCGKCAVNIPCEDRIP